MEPAADMPATPDATRATTTRAEALQAVLAIVRDARNGLWIRVRKLDAGVFDQPEILDALRALAVRNPGRADIRILVQEATGLAQSSLLPLIQRLTSSFRIRETVEEPDRAYPSAFIASDSGGWWFGPLAGSYEGQTALGQPGAVRQLREAFLPAWERARPCSELRTLAI